MSKLGLILGAVIVLIVAFGAYVRLAPTEPGDWHLEAYPKGPGDYPFEGGFEAIRPLDRPPAEVLAEADRIILQTPRTTRIAGSVDEGRVTYITRSALWGFPDFTTIWINEGDAPSIAFYGRLRFGRSDMGVNEARIRGWLEELGLGA